jgi:hypothetical protein
LEVDVTDKPKLMPFTDDNMRKVIVGTKTMTRRVITKPPQPIDAAWHWYSQIDKFVCGYKPPAIHSLRSPYGHEKDTVLCREALTCITTMATRGAKIGQAYQRIAYRTTGTIIRDSEWPWQVSTLAARYMPRAYARYGFVLNEVRAERLHDITPREALREGIQRSESGLYYFTRATTYYEDAVTAFAELWTAINGKRPGCAWPDNPWVWVYGWNSDTVHQIERR